MNKQLSNMKFLKNFPQDAKTLNDQLILTMEDVSRLDDADWKELNLTSEVKAKLTKKLQKLKKSGKKSASSGSDSAFGSPRLKKKNKSGRYSSNSDSGSGSPRLKKKNKPGRYSSSSGGSSKEGRYNSKSSASSISASSSGFSSGNSSASSNSSSGEGRYKTKPSKKAWKKSSSKYGKLDPLTKEKLRQVNQAMRAAHRLALRAELESIRRADDLAKLQRKRAELARLYRKYKAQLGGKPSKAAKKPKRYSRSKSRSKSRSRSRTSSVSS